MITRERDLPGLEDATKQSYYGAPPGWVSARLDIVNGLLLMACAAQTVRQSLSVLRMAREARDVGLLSHEEAHDTTLIADIRMMELERLQPA